MEQIDKRNERFILGFIAAVIGLPLAALILVSGSSADMSPEYHHQYPVSCEVSSNEMRIRQLYKGRVVDFLVKDGIISGEAVYRGRAARGGIALKSIRDFNVERLPAHPFYDHPYLRLRNGMNNVLISMDYACAGEFASYLSPDTIFYGYDIRG